MTDGKCKEKVGNAFQPITVKLGGKKIFAQKLGCAGRTTLKRCERLKKSKEEEEEEEEIKILMSHLCSSQSEILRIWDCFSFGPEAVVCSLSSSFGCLMDKAAQRRNVLVRSCLTTSEQIIFFEIKKYILVAWIYNESIYSHSYSYARFYVFGSLINLLI